MDRVWKSGAAGTPPVHTENASSGYPSAGNPATATAATKPGPWMWHLIVENLRNLVVAAGLTPDKSLTNQVLLAMQTQGIFGGTLFNATHVKFPAIQVPSADANTLDDYREVQFSPIIGGSGGQSGQAYAVQVGRARKMGRWVDAYCHVQLSTAGSISGNLVIGNLPFPMATLSNHASVATIYFDNMGTSWINIVGRLTSGGTAMTLRGLAAAAGQMATLSAADVLNSTVFIMRISYETDN